jgi:3-hydroxybutyryl-CoA dehydrogenase/3-hydroxyacyl-CoA dehydrogenase
MSAQRGTGELAGEITGGASGSGAAAARAYGARLREAARVVEEGVATHEQVKQFDGDCFRWPVGPFAMVKGATSGWKK